MHLAVACQRLYGIIWYDFIRDISFILTSYSIGLKRKIYHKWNRFEYAGIGFEELSNGRITFIKKSQKNRKDTMLETDECQIR